MESLSWSIGYFNELTTNQLYEILALRQEVFIVEQECAYPDADQKDQNSFHLMGYNDQNELMAYSRIVNPGISYKEPAIGRIVTSPKCRGKGIGKQLMVRSIQESERLFGSVSIRLSAQCYLIKFYESHQFKVVSEEYLEDGIPHVEMLREKF